LLFPEETLVGAAAALSLAASAFLPVLVLGIWWKRLGSDAALAGMVAGLLVCLYYMIAPHTIPFLFYESSSLLSDATAAQAAAFEALRHDYYATGDVAIQAAILSDWEASVRPIANWLGVHGALAGVFAVPAGFLVTILVGLFTPAPSARRQRFFETLRAKPV
jgi:cation/acetate symporter